MGNQSYKNENIETIYLNIMQRNQFLKVKNNLLELEKDFIDLKDIELKDRVIKIKKEIEKEIVFIETMDRLEEEEMKKLRPIKNIWYDWLINYIPKPIRKSVSVLKDKFIILFNTNTSK